MYEEGKGTLPDYQKAILWYEEAIKNNFVEAELFYRLGNLYEVLPQIKKKLNN